MGLWSWPLYSNPASSSWFRLHRSLGLGGSQGWISESSRRTLGTDSLLMAEAERQLVVVVEGTAVLRPYWSTILTDYIEKHGMAAPLDLTSLGFSGEPAWGMFLFSIARSLWAKIGCQGFVEAWAFVGRFKLS